MISVENVKARLGIPVTNPHEDVLIQEAIDAGYAFMAETRPSVDWTAASPSQRLGLLWLISRFYQEQGQSDSEVSSYEGVIPLIGRQANQLLGLGVYAPVVVS